MKKSVLWMSLFTPCIVLMLLGSFGMHAVQVSHGHTNDAHHHGEGSEQSESTVLLGEVMHVADKKLMVILSTFLLFGAGVVFAFQGTLRTFLLQMRVLFLSVVRKRKEVMLLIFDYLQCFFCRGILHPKLY